MPDARPARLTIRAAQVLLVVSAAGLWAASRLTWVELHVFDGLGPPTWATLSGAGWSSALLPLALLLLATALAALAVRNWALRALAVLVALASLAAGYLAISTLETPDLAARGAELAHVPLLELVGSKRHYPGPVITLVTAVGMLVAAALLMRAAASAGRTATKYLAPAARRSAARRDHEAPSERTMWDELDEGRDPTDPADDPPTEPDTEGR
ncbi:TIGR02234 family membrane protein [Mycobacterium sp.]|uniref:TIGR02234 family membrane protein n=1 Tax=Mycobacterium sp. TaxID=1785 RepID=UPI0031DDF161